MTKVDYTSIDIVQSSEYDDLLYWYAEKVYKKEDESSVENFLQNVISVEYFPNTTFHDLLKQYYAEKGEQIEDKVRAYFPYKNGFLMTHGCGYAWETEDIFDGDKKAFVEWLKNKDMELEG